MEPPNTYVPPIPEGEPTFASLLDSLVAQTQPQYSFVDEATWHLNANGQEQFHLVETADVQLADFDLQPLENPASMLVDEDMSTEDIFSLIAFTQADDGCARTAPVKTSNPQFNNMALSEFAEHTTALEHSAEFPTATLEISAHSVVGSTAITAPENINSTGYHKENHQSHAVNPVNLESFEPKLAVEYTNLKMRQGINMHSRTATTAESSDIRIGDDYPHHQPSYPSPIPNEPYSINSGATEITTHHLQGEMGIATPPNPIRQGKSEPKLKFSSTREANSWRAFEVQVDHDPTIPKTKEEKLEIVSNLLDAMKSTKHAEDNEGMIRPFREQKHSPIRMEIVCWNILEACISRQTNGPLLAIYDGKAKATSQISTFKERMEKIVDCLLTQKTICKHLLDAHYMFTFVDDPVFSKSRVVANKNLNKRKGEVMTAGKKALGHSKSNSKSTPTKGDSQAADGLRTPFSTPRRKSAAKETSPPLAINTNVRNMTLSSPHVASQLLQQPTGFSRPAHPSTQGNMVHSIHQSNALMNLHKLANMPHASGFYQNTPAVSTGHVGNIHRSHFGPGVVRSQSTNAMHGLGRNIPSYYEYPFNQEQMEPDRYVQYSPTAAHLQEAMYYSPPLPSPRRVMVPTPYPWSYDLTTTPSPHNHASNIAQTVASYGHGRKRSQDENDCSDTQASPQKKAR
ncbi:hypothetical protein ACO22_04067 [Paracoccidioides brasiliensis]|uniref:Uncharacterized protein n=1 Tax=Paracoccidioides brasiliensis TaxID=121759 RepID=A0A1D2JE29_PARBR|nr:hypothetical protein ACO22_04067 [Paracoccidioides brasiliensis]